MAPKKDPSAAPEPHPFEASGCGFPPFTFIAHLRSRVAHTSAEPRPAAFCDHCGARLAHALIIRDADGRIFPVGADCVRRACGVDDPLQLAAVAADQDQGDPVAKTTGIDWDAQPLGSVSDVDLADQLGVTPGAVRQQRAKRGIPACQSWRRTGRPRRAPSGPLAGLTDEDAAALERDVGASSLTIRGWQLGRRPLPAITDAIADTLHRVSPDRWPDPDVLGRALRSMPSGRSAT